MILNLEILGFKMCYLNVLDVICSSREFEIMTIVIFLPYISYIVILR